MNLGLNEVQVGFEERMAPNGVIYYVAPMIERAGVVRHGFTSRIGGRSEPPYDSLNLSFKRAPGTEETVRENYRLAAEAIEIDYNSLVVCNYEHGGNVERVRAEHHGMGIWRKNTLNSCDGVMVTDKDTAGVTIHADCCPIFLVDIHGRAATVAHAGWKGTRDAITKYGLEKMAALGIGKEDILAAVGPCISGANYEIGEDVAGQFADYAHAITRKDGKIFLDLTTIHVLQLTQAGIPNGNITISGLCTYVDREHFFSHRRDGKNAGAMGSFIQLLG